MYYFALVVGLAEMLLWHRKASAKTQVSLTKFLQSEVKINTL